MEGPLAARPGECWAARLARSGSAGGRAAARLLGDGGAAGRGVWAARPAGQPCDAEGRPGRRACGREGLAGGHRSKAQLPSSLPWPLLLESGATPSRPRPAEAQICSMRPPVEVRPRPLCRPRRRRFGRTCCFPGCAARPVPGGRGRAGSVLFRGEAEANVLFFPKFLSILHVKILIDQSILFFVYNSISLFQGQRSNSQRSGRSRISKFGKFDAQLGCRSKFRASFLCKTYKFRASRIKSFDETSTSKKTETMF